MMESFAQVSHLEPNFAIALSMPWELVTLSALLQKTPSSLSFPISFLRTRKKQFFPFLFELAKIKRATYGSNPESITNLSEAAVRWNALIQLSEYLVLPSAQIGGSSSGSQANIFPSIF